MTNKTYENIADKHKRPTPKRVWDSHNADGNRKPWKKSEHAHGTIPLFDECGRIKPEVK